jgi:hypothetical protein
LQHALALKQRRRSRIKAIKVQEVKRVIRQSIVPAASEIVLQCAKVWAAVSIRANDLAVQNELGGRKAREARDDGRETARPVKSTAGIKPHATVLYVRLHPIAIQLEFMDQAACGRDFVPREGEARLDKSRKGRHLGSWKRSGERAR